MQQTLIFHQGYLYQKQNKEILVFGLWEIVLQRFSCYNAEMYAQDDVSMEHDYYHDKYV